MTRESMLERSKIGAARRPKANTMNLDPVDVLRSISEDPFYALEKVLYAYEKGQEATGFKIGDKVKVRKSSWHLGHERGWGGYATMFAQYKATVTDISVRPSDGLWFVIIEYPFYQRWNNYPAPGDYHITNEKTSFMFNYKQIKLVKAVDGRRPAKINALRNIQMPGGL